MTIYHIIFICILLGMIYLLLTLHSDKSSVIAGGNNDVFKNIANSAENVCNVVSNTNEKLKQTRMEVLNMFYNNNHNDDIIDISNRPQGLYMI